MRLFSFQSTWAAAALIAALTLIATWPLGLRLTDSLPGDYGDPVFVTWAIGWVSGTLTDTLTQPSALARLWDANIFFPEAQTLAFSEHFIGQSILTLPFYWASGNLLLSYNVAFLASFFLTGLGTFLLTRALTGSAIGALIAAVVATFNEYRLVWALSHLHVLSIQWLPFALYALHRYFETDKRRWLLGAAAALIALNLSSIYYMAYSAPLIVLFVAFELAVKGRWRTPRLWLELWATAAFVVVVTLPAMLPYVEVQQRLGIERSTAEVVRYSARWISMGSRSPVWSQRSFSPSSGLLAPLSVGDVVSAGSLCFHSFLPPCRSGSRSVLSFSSEASRSRRLRCMRCCTSCLAMTASGCRRALRRSFFVPGGASQPRRGSARGSVADHGANRRGPVGRWSRDLVEAVLITGTTGRFHPRDSRCRPQISRRRRRRRQSIRPSAR